MEYGCIGKKLSHSFSKLIHNELADYEYELKEIDENELDEFFEKSDFKAINVTIPYKLDVIKYLDFIDDTARDIGAVNTIVNKNGKLYGYNTDFLGLKALIEFAKISLLNKKVLILGTGGTSLTAMAVAKAMGANEVIRVSRSSSQDTITYECAEKCHTDADIIINTTPCGMFPNIGTSAINLDDFNKLSGVVDAVYNPLASQLIVSAKQKGINAIGGLYMLVAQAVFAVEKFLEKEFEFSEIERIFNKLFKQKQNLCLIGMPSCGKTTIGKEIARELQKEFIDSDEEIVKLTKMSIPDIFENYGEAHFRELESMVIANLALKQNCVIATGGGSVLNKRNVELLKQNGMLIFLDRPIEQLITTDDRPLSSSRELLEKRYKERYGIYLSVADKVVNIHSDIQKNINLVKEGFLNENSCN
ncbi:MAG: AAA family ATPase [Ruminococcaceae bacterium]|nr:AAA family ATPase [Oscillospiraceae bacterium]